jgi:hypothetical protein
MIANSCSDGWTSLFYLWSLCLSVSVILAISSFSRSLHESFMRLDRPGQIADDSVIWRTMDRQLPPRIDYASRPGKGTEAPIICFLVESGIPIEPKGVCDD